MTNERLTLSYWLRRPIKNAAPTSFLDDIRSDAFNDESEDFINTINAFKHDIETVSTLKELEKLLLYYNIDYEDVVDDSSAFKASIDDNDIDSAINQIKMNIDKWVESSISASKGTNDLFSLKGHPNRRVMGGGPSLKRSMGY